MNENIFINIASYKDPLLKTTIESAYDNASNKNNLVFGVVEQNDLINSLNLKDFVFKSQIRYIRLDPEYARGACFPRNLAQTLYNKEKYYFQIDSHMLFENNWDSILIEEFNKLRQWHEKPLITAYPWGFKYDINGGITLEKRTNTNELLALIVEHGYEFVKDEYYVPAKTKILSKSEPVHGYMLSGNFVFTHGTFCYEVPYDPFLYFSGEEHSLALRAWTNGYNIFHIPHIPLYHCYSREYRTTHWGDTQIEEEKQIKWWQYDKMSKERLTHIVTGKPLGIYGIGNIRSLEDYSNFCGIDYCTKSVINKEYYEEKVFEMDWRKPILLT